MCSAIRAHAGILLLCMTISPARTNALDAAQHASSTLHPPVAGRTGAHMTKESGGELSECKVSSLDWHAPLQGGVFFYTIVHVRMMLANRRSKICRSISGHVHSDYATHEQASTCYSRREGPHARQASPRLSAVLFRRTARMSRKGPPPLCKHSEILLCSKPSGYSTWQDISGALIRQSSGSWTLSSRRCRTATSLLAPFLHLLLVLPPPDNHATEHNIHATAERQKAFRLFCGFITGAHRAVALLAVEFSQPCCLSTASLHP